MRLARQKAVARDKSLRFETAEEFLARSNRPGADSMRERRTRPSWPVRRDEGGNALPERSRVAAEAGVGSP